MISNFFTKKKNNLVFTASNHQPNIDACNYIFKFAIKLPNYHFKIIGNIKDVFNEFPSNVKFYGVISEEEKKEIYKKSFIALNPIVSGSGSNMKLLDYLQNGLVCLSTKFGLRGFESLEDCCFVEDVNNFVFGIQKILSLSDKEILSKVTNNLALVTKMNKQSELNFLEIPKMLKKKKSNFFFYDNSLVYRNTTGTERYTKELYSDVEMLDLNTYIKGIDLRNLNIDADIKKSSSFHRTHQFFHHDELIAAIKFKNILYTYHDSMLYKYPYYFENKKDYEIFKFAFELSFKVSKKIIAHTHSNKEELISLFGVDENRIKVIYLGINRNKFQKLDLTLNRNNFIKLKKKYKIPDNFFLTVSTDYPHKNLNQLSTLADKMNEINELRAYKIVLAGNRYYHDKKYNYISKNIIYLGPISDHELNTLYNFSLIFLNFSLDEGFGMCNLEAQHLGIPVICSNIKPFKELLGDSALYIDPNITKDILNSCIKLIKDKSLMKLLSNKGKLNSEKFSWEKCRKEVFNLINELS